MRRITWTCLALVLTLAACAPGSTPAATPSLEPVNLAGPQMTLGSSWLYADGSLLVPVPAGPFSMGIKDGRDNPEHPVNLPDYWIFRTKVTNAQYAYCVGSGGCTPPFAHDNPGFSDYLHANDPVVGVDYGQAAAYCSFVHARLPSEAEWEKAARGPDAAIYPWGDAVPACDLLNFDICVGKTTPVNNYPQGQSYYHAFDMEGNAFEWVADWYQADYYLNAPPDSPQGPESGLGRVVRSSAFNSGGDQIPAYTRGFSRPDIHRDNLGFRCVVEDPAYFSPFCEFPPVYGTEGIGGASSGIQVKVDCPDLSIEQNPTCVAGLPLTYIILNASPFDFSHHYSSQMTGQCTEAFGQGGLFAYACTGDAQIRLCGECSVYVTIPPKCPDGYTYDAAAHTCMGQGTSGACLPGYTTTTSSGGGCCTLVPGTPAPTANPLSYGFTTNLMPGAGCPAGAWSFFNPSTNSVECLPVPVESPYCKSTGVALKSCSGGGGKDCNITEQSCAATCNPLGYIYDAAACSCTCNAG